MHLNWTHSGSTRHIKRVLILLSLLVGWLTGVPSWAGAIQDVRVRGDSVVVTFSAPVARASSFVLAQPQRIALDVAGVTPGSSSHAGGPITAIRQGSQGAAGARIVLDLSRPAIVTEGKFTGDGRTLTLQLRTVDDSRFARAAAERRLSFLPPFSFAAATGPKPYSASITLPRRALAKLPKVYGDASRPLVVIDAGHGGHDPGAIGANGEREKDLTLRSALAIRDALLASSRVRVALTREDDRYLILQERYGLARKLKADLFISVHCDSAGNPSASGATVYTLSEVASDKEAARLAARENKADIINGVDLGAQDADISSILIDLTQRETMNTSAKFARLLGREAKALIPVRENFHRMASLMVLKAPDMPSILFETGYLSNSNDALFIASPEGQKRIAQSVRRAVEIHFATQMAAR